MGYAASLWGNTGPIEVLTELGSHAIDHYVSESHPHTNTAFFKQVAASHNLLGASPVRARFLPTNRVLPLPDMTGLDLGGISLAHLGWSTNILCTEALANEQKELLTKLEQSGNIPKVRYITGQPINLRQFLGVKNAGNSNHYDGKQAAPQNAPTL